MSKFHEYKSLNLPLIHKKVLEQWENSDVFIKSIEMVFYITTFLELVIFNQLKS